MPVIKSLDALKPDFCKNVDTFFAMLNAAGILFRLDETLRTQDVQNAYWLQSRAPLDEVNAARSRAGLYLLTENENKVTVTWTRKSPHFGGEAVDVVPLVNTKKGLIVPWDYEAYADVWLRMGKLGISAGLQWGGTWLPHNSGGVGKDPPHYQKAA